MRVLILSDIHANWPALQAILDDETDKFDECLVIGDLVDYGSSAIEVIEWIQDHATAVIRGNHDHAVAQFIKPKKGEGLHRLMQETRYVHWTQLANRHLHYLARLPVSTYVTLGETRFFLVHATPRDPMSEYLLHFPKLWKIRLAEVNADVVCVGHTHVPFIHDFGDKILVNPGSVGQPRDGNPQASYAVFEDGEIELKRVHYEWNHTLDHMREHGISPRAIEIAEAILSQGTTGITLPRYREVNA